MLMPVSISHQIQSSRKVEYSKTQTHQVDKKDQKSLAKIYESLGM